MLQNRELLEHINALVGRLQELEMQLTGAEPVQRIMSPPVSLTIPFCTDHAISPG